jgi:carboxymethylenebutenolidase
MSEMNTTTVPIPAAEGVQIEGYLARPATEGSRGGVVIHHMLGFDRATKEITRRFAEMRYDAICPNLRSPGLVIRRQ